MYSKDDMDDLMDEESDSSQSSGGEIAKTLVFAFLVVVFIRCAIAEPFSIPTGSMVPTLAIGDKILVTKYDYGWRFPLTRVPITEIKVPERGDVIVFVFPGSDVDVPKRYFL